MVSKQGDRDLKIGYKVSLVLSQSSFPTRSTGSRLEVLKRNHSRGWASTQSHETSRLFWKCFPKWKRGS